jgi:YggT family protein
MRTLASGSLLRRRCGSARPRCAGPDGFRHHTEPVSAVSVIAEVAYVVLVVYFLVLWVRFILELVQAFSQSWRPRGAVLVLAEVSFTLTDPPIRAVRRVIPPLRVGAFALDFGFTIVMFAVIILLNVALAF